MIKYFLRVHALLSQALSSKGSEEVNMDGYSEYGGQGQRVSSTGATNGNHALPQLCRCCPHYTPDSVNYTPDITSLAMSNRSL